MTRQWIALTAASALLLGVLTSGVTTASAQEPATAAEPDAARVAAARDLVKAMDAEGQTRGSLAQLRQALIARMQASEPAKVVGFTAYVDKEMRTDGPLVKDFLADLDAMAVQFYARNFTPEEMKAIAAFQMSEAGRKFNALTPELGGLVAARMNRFQSDLIKAVEKGAAGQAK